MNSVSRRGRCMGELTARSGSFLRYKIWFTLNIINRKVQLIKIISNTNPIGICVLCMIEICSSQLSVGIL